MEQVTIVAEKYEAKTEDAVRHEVYMHKALEQARIARDLGDVPVGAVVVRDGEVIAVSGNRRAAVNDPSAHAEMLAIRRAAELTGNWRLEKCSLYVTLEPCVMCAGAIVLARVPLVVYGASDPKAGAVESLYHILSDSRLNHRPDVVSGVLADDCSAILTEFFRYQRSLGKK